MHPSELPPSQYFISHSYNDRMRATTLIKLMPSHARAFMFDPIRCTPLEFVSNTLIGSILTCDALIYVQSFASDDSFWVAFEREYALRAGRKVYSFRWSTQTLSIVDREPVDLTLFFSAAVEDYPVLKDIKTFMAEARFFDFIFPHDEMSRNVGDHRLADLFSVELGRDVTFRARLRESWMGQVVERLLASSVFKDGSDGNMVVFWSRYSKTSFYQADDLRIAETVVANVLRGVPASDVVHARQLLFDELNRRILFACLDETPVPEWVREPVQLYGDAERSMLNRVDDLIVALYWRFVSASEPKHKQFRSDLKEARGKSRPAFL